MSEGDAEWIGEEFEPRTRPPPRPRPTTPRITTTTRTNNPFPRPRRPGARPRPRPRDAPERVAPDSKTSSYNATTISVSVVSVVFLVALVLLLLYLFVLRKKLRKVEQKNHDSQYCLRVEDVSHLEVDDSAKLYINTTDLEKLVSTVRIKNKKQPPPIPQEFDYPDVVKVGRPPAPLPENAAPLNGCNSDTYTGTSATFTDTGFTNPVLSHSNSAEMIYATVSEESRPSSIISRPAPPIPPSSTLRKQFRSNEAASEKTITMLDAKYRPPSDIYSENMVAPQKVSKPPPPPVMSKPILPSSHTLPVSSEYTSNSKQKPPPPMTSKPKFTPPAPPTKSKPSSSSRPTPEKPLLPRLKMNLRSPVNGSDSGFSTPETALSYLNDSETPTLSVYSESETMSVKARRALLEGVFANTQRS